jgi:hypothetical protein
MWGNQNPYPPWWMSYPPYPTTPSVDPLTMSREARKEARRMNRMWRRIEKELREEDKKKSEGKPNDKKITFGQWFAILILSWPIIGSVYFLACLSAARGMKIMLDTLIK